MSQLTERALAQSLKKISQKKSLNKITIQELAEDCGINRMTFYYHFKDIYDLIEWVCKEDAMAAIEENRTYDTWQQGMLKIFEMALENKPFIMNVSNCIHQEQVEKYLRPQVDSLVMGIIYEELGDMIVSDEDKDFIARAYSYLFVGFMLDWIKGDMQGDPAKLVEKLSILIKGSIFGALSRFKK